MVETKADACTAPVQLELAKGRWITEIRTVTTLIAKRDEI